MSPDLTGQGMGRAFVGAVLAEVGRRLGSVRSRLTVATFNARAIRVYEQLGFVKSCSFVGNGGCEFQVMIDQMSEV
ncbi:GNAT family N-acetyltransferase [Alicyclobacillus fastidiosus]|uniref:GNAT family protein n=1 Tax=Alicyclobacillus fastidiosus TaxID=392011 RepID=A0ABV5AH30_9BACL|nr:GNAT family protein [Alicyclobacillus fastidiosus]WEH07937.1 GNAT family protein [Alicyclobacillus fastidiosus]